MEERCLRVVVELVGDSYYFIGFKVRLDGVNIENIY